MTTLLATRLRQAADAIEAADALELAEGQR
jgi:hypothetical protein